jgi:hypothetical protein
MLFFYAFESNPLPLSSQNQNEDEASNSVLDTRSPCRRL